MGAVLAHQGGVPGASSGPFSTHCSAHAKQRTGVPSIHGTNPHLSFFIKSGLATSSANLHTHLHVRGYSESRAALMTQGSQLLKSAAATVSPACLAMCGALLEPDSAKRLGSVEKGASSLQSHAWLDGIDWEAFGVLLALRCFTLMPRLTLPSSDSCARSRYDPSGSNNSPPASW